MNCKNCNTQITNGQNFCSNCGELINPKRLKVKSILGLFISNFFSFDNKFSKTFKDLTIRPHTVIDSYVNGYRKKYINAIGYFGLALTLTGFQFFVLRRFFPELLFVDVSKNPDALTINNTIMDMNSIMDSYYQYQGILNLFFIPFYAFASWVTFLDSKKYNFAEHFVINIYANAHIFISWFAITLILLPLKFNYNLFSQFSIVILFIYMVFVFKKIYNISILNSFFRTLVYYVIASILIIGIVLIFGVGYAFYLAYTGEITAINAH